MKDSSNRRGTLKKLMLPLALALGVAAPQVQAQQAPLQVTHVGQFPAATIGFDAAPGHALGDAVKAGTIKIVGEANTDGWKPENAQKNMEQILTETDNGVDAVVASNDGTAGGVVAALTAQGMAGIPVSGQDGDMAALNRVALGTQTVSVWKDSRALGKAAGEIAVALANGTAMDAVEGSAKFTSPGGKELNSVLLKPVPITKDNLNVVLDAGWITKETLCAGVSGVAVCE